MRDSVTIGRRLAQEAGHSLLLSIAWAIAAMLAGKKANLYYPALGACKVRTIQMLEVAK